MSVGSALIVDTQGLDTDTVERIRTAVAKILAEASDFEPDPAAVGGWTVTTAAQLCLRLERTNRPVQAHAIASAAHSGGFVDRATVYDLGGYDEERSLKGWTRPVGRLTQLMITERLLPADALIPLTAVYDPSNSSLQKTMGFRMPAELVPVFAQAVPAPHPRPR